MTMASPTECLCFTRDHPLQDRKLAPSQGALASEMAKTAVRGERGVL
jgi:hypothetical protein